MYVWAEAGGTPTREAFAMPNLLESKTAGQRRKPWQVGQVVFPCDLDATLHAALENTLDVPHTAFLHKGIFRGKRLKELTAVRRDFDGGVEVEFLGEPVGLGPIQGGPLAKKTFQHWDRFLMPHVAQVEYRVDDWLEIFNNVIHLPMSPTRDARLVRVPLVDAGAGEVDRADRGRRRAAWCCGKTSARWRSSRGTSTASAANGLRRPTSTCWARRSGACCARPSAPTSARLSALDDALVEGADRLTFEA